MIGFLRKTETAGDAATGSWRPRLALASASPRRLALLQQIGVEPDGLLPTDLDESPHRNEGPRALAVRLANEKARAGAKAASRAG